MAMTCATRRTVLQQIQKLVGAMIEVKTKLATMSAADALAMLQ
jgi:Holliday junction resolvasome RuvABC endonuclease subunit